MYISLWVCFFTCVSWINAGILVKQITINHYLVYMTLITWARCLINLSAFCLTPWICNFINSLISWVHLLTESNLCDTDNIAPFENTTPINLVNLVYVLLFWSIGVVFSNCTILSISEKYDSVNEHTQEIDINENTCFRGVAKAHEILGNWLIEVTGLKVKVTQWWSYRSCELGKLLNQWRDLNQNHKLLLQSVHELTGSKVKVFWFNANF